MILFRPYVRPSFSLKRIAHPRLWSKRRRIYSAASQMPAQAGAKVIIINAAKKQASSASPAFCIHIRG